MAGFRLRDDRGSTAIEYALVASLIALAIVSAIISLSGTLTSTFYNSIATAL